MSEYKEYSKDLWNYLGDMPYMPTRADRDQLVASGQKMRVSIWDYFFEINPNDVGLPQKREIADITKQVDGEITAYNKRQKEIQDSLGILNKELFLLRSKFFAYGACSLFVAALASKLMGDAQYSLRTITIIAAPFILAGMALWAAIAIVGKEQRSTIKKLQDEAVKLHDSHRQSVKEKIKRKRFLEAAIEELKKQIPAPPSGSEVRQWLKEDLSAMKNHAIKVTGLGTRLVEPLSAGVDDAGNPVLQQNPTLVYGPAELQDYATIPLSFKDLNPDLGHHLYARRACPLPESDGVDVLYGTYYLECILFGDNMLATCGFFYDFISSKIYAEHTIEQYYEDVISTAITNEHKIIALDANAKETAHIENAPTFTISLASGDKQTITFVNERYFMEIREKIGINGEGIAKIVGIKAARKTVENAISALRHYVRLHKSTASRNNQQDKSI